jgi:hypothetical protein
MSKLPSEQAEQNKVATSSKEKKRVQVMEAAASLGF